MEKTLASLGVSLAAAGALLAPVHALAYLSPDQVFGNAGTSTTTHSAAAEESTFDRTDTAFPPPNLRDGDTIAAERAAAGQQRLATQEMNNQQTLPVDDYVAAEDLDQPSLLNNDVNYQKRMERIGDSKGNGPTIIIGGNGTVVDSNGNVLHSGAPIITSTGPESVLAIIAMVLAGACTFVYSSVVSRTPRVALS